MTDRVHPSSKSTTTNGAAAIATATNPSFPATKAQLYGTTRPTYRPQPYNNRSRRSCCCSLFFWLILILFILLLLLGIAGTVIYFLYRPSRPSFSVTSFKLSYLNLTTSSSTLNSKFDLTISTTNPNKKILFSYEPTSVSILSGDVNIGKGYIPSFVHEEKNTTLLRTSVSSSMQALESDKATQLEDSMKSKNGLELKVMMETKVEAKMGALKTPHVGIRALCDGITVTLPAGKKMTPTAVTATSSKAECEVNVKFKVWKWTVG